MRFQNSVPWLYDLIQNLFTHLPYFHNLKVTLKLEIIVIFIRHLKGLYAIDTENIVSSNLYSLLKKINFRPQVIFLF